MRKQLKISQTILTGIKNASSLAIGNVMSEVVTFVTFLFIARYFIPEDYGIYTTVLSFVGIFEVFTIKGINKSIIRSASQNEEDINNIINTGASFRTYFIIISIVLCNTIVQFLPYTLNTKILVGVFSMNLFFHELTRFYFSGLYVKDQFKKIATQTIYNRIVFAVLCFLIIILELNINYLVISTLSVNIIFMFVTIMVLRKVGIKVKPIPSPKFVKEYFKSGITFSMFEAVTMLATRFDIILISFLGGPKEVGLYGVAFKVAQQALMLRNVNQDAFFPLFVKRLKTGNVKIKTVIIPSIVMFSVIFIPTIGFYFYSKEIITLLFGENYSEAGPILFYLLIFVSFAWGTLPFTVLAQASYNEKILLKVRIYMAIANIFLDIIFYRLFGLIGIAYVSALVWSIGSVFICFFVYKSIYLRK